MTNVMQFPWGSRITVRATTNKDLVQVRVEQQQETGPRRKPSEEPSAVLVRPSPEGPRSFRHAIGTLTKETTVLFTLFDTDGIRSREPVPLTLAAVEDERPRLSVRLQGIGTAGAAIAPRAMLPVAGQVTDDYGIARVWFEYAVDQKPAAAKQIAALSGNLTEYPLKLPESLLDAAGLDLKPGQKFGVCVKAEDRFSLGSGPNVGSGDRWVLDVVTPQQLQTMLKARQLVLRQRFEETIKKVEYTRNLLAGLDFSPPKKPEPPKDPAAKRAEPKSGEKAAPPKPESGAEAPSAAERLAQRTLDVRSAAENSVTDAHEILGLAEAFSEIRQELVNNRIDDEEGKRRLQDEIAVPLRRIGGEMFADLDRQLDRLQETIADAAKGAESRDQAVRQTDAILLAMRQALGKMSRLEDLNEVIETLRAIIRAQEKVQVLTKQRQKESLTELKEKLP